MTASLRAALRTARSSRRLLTAGLVLAGGTVTIAVARRCQLRATLRRLVRLLLRALGVEVVVRGPAPRGPALLVANHLSWLDIVVASACWPCTFVAKCEVASWPLVGWLGRRIGVVFIDRQRRRDLLHSIPAVEAALRRGELVLLFPEGTTTDGQRVLPFKSALFEAAVRAGAPVVPVTLGGAVEDGAPSALCWTGDESLASHLPRLASSRRTRMTVHVGAPIDVAAARIATGDGAPCAGDGGTRARAPRKQVARIAQSQVERRFTPIRSAPATWRWPDHVERITVGAAVGGSSLVAALLLWVGALYLACPWYEAVPGRPFSGAAWYNPYADAPDDPAAWATANFHAHSVAWGGLTHGLQPAEAVINRYRAMGYDVIGVSNYHAPTQRGGSFPVYEHGWNVTKAHRLVFAPDRVTWLDYPFGQGRHQQQHVLDQLRRSAQAVAIAHPALRDGHGEATLRTLGGYDLIEVLNHFTPPAESHWDAALSSGHAAFLVANDDMHDLRGEGETGRYFTRVLVTDVDDATTRTAPSALGRAHGASPVSPPIDRVIAALRAGRSYGVAGHQGRSPLRLVSVRMHGDTLSVQVAGPVTRVRVVGQEGAVRADVTGAAAAAGTVRVVAQTGDGYLRVVAEGDDAGRPTAIWLNPVVRWDGRELPVMIPVVDRAATLRWRVAVGGTLAVMLSLGVLSRRRRRLRATPIPTAGLA